MGADLCQIFAARACARCGPTSRFAGLFCPASGHKFSMPAPDPSAWVVHKFGGSSVADADCFRRVANILETLPPGRLGVVLSACRGVTDALLGLVARAEAQDDCVSRRPRCAARAARHHRAVGADAGSGAAVHGRLRSRPPRHRRHPAHRQADALGGTERARPDRRLRRDLVHQAVPRILRGARQTPGRRAVDRRARVRGGGVGPAGSRRCSGKNRAPSCGSSCRARCFRRHADHHRLHRLGPPRRADDAGPQRQRLLGFDLRLAARRQRNPHLDRRGRRAVGRSAPRAGRQGHRLAVVQRGHGAGVFRRQGDPSADHGAGRGPRHPDLDPQHLRARQAGLADLRQARPPSCRSRASPPSRTSRW